MRQLIYTAAMNLELGHARLDRCLREPGGRGRMSAVIHLMMVRSTNLDRSATVGPTCFQRDCFPPGPRWRRFRKPKLRDALGLHTCGHCGRRRGLKTDIHVFPRIFAEHTWPFGADCAVLVVHYRGLRGLQMSGALLGKIKAYWRWLDGHG